MLDILKDPTYSNLVSGFIGSIIGFLAAVFVALLQHHWSKKAAEKQRAHEMRLLQEQKEHDNRMFEKQVRQDRDMQRRDANIKNTGTASLREVGGG